MHQLTSLPAVVVFPVAILVVLIIADLAHRLLLRFVVEDDRERVGGSAAAYMTALGSLFAILTGFLINSEYTTLRNANTLVAEQTAAASRIGWATEGLPSVVAARVQDALATFLDDVYRTEFIFYETGAGERSPALASFSELQKAVFEVSAQPYAPASSVSGMEGGLGALTTVRGELQALSEQQLPLALFLLCVVAGLALIANAVLVSIRQSRGNPIVAISIVVVVALDLALIIAVSAPFRGGFVASRQPVAALASQVRAGQFASWVPSTSPGPAFSCDDDPAGCVEVAVGAPINLGTLLHMEGSGRDSLRGVELAIDQLDGALDGQAGQLLGHPIQLASEDDGCNPVDGRRGAVALLADRQIVAAIGTSCSGAAFGQADVAFSEMGVLLISPSATSPALTAPETGQRFFARTAPNDLIQSAVLAEFVLTLLGLDRLAIIKQPDAYSSALSEAFGSRFTYGGGSIATVEMLSDDPDDVEFAAALDRVAATEVEVLFAPMNAKHCEAMVRAVRADPRLDDVAVLTGDSCLTESVGNSLVGPDPNVFASIPDSDRRNNSFYTEVLRPSYKALFGVSPSSSFYASAFDATNMVFDAIRRSAEVGPGNALRIPRTSLRDAFLEIQGWEGAAGDMSCDATGDCARRSTISVFEAPNWPVGENGDQAEPVYSQTLVLDQVIADR